MKLKREMQKLTWSHHLAPIAYQTTGLCSQWCQFFNSECVWVWHCSLSICGSIMYAVQDQGASQCILFMVLYLGHIWMCRLHTAVSTHWFTYVPPRCRTPLYCSTFIPLPVYSWNSFKHVYCHSYSIQYKVICWQNGCKD